MRPVPTADTLRALMRRRPVRTTFVKLASLEVVDLLAASSFDAVIVDFEHSQLDESEARALVRHATALRLPAIVRIATLDGSVVNRMLEAGAVGVQLSSIESPAQAEALRRSVRYPPAGNRSVSLAQPAAGYGAVGLASHVAEPGGPPLAIGQIETGRGVEAAEQILRNLDVGFIGSTDLAVDLGHAVAQHHVEVLDAMGSVAEAAKVCGTNLGVWVSSVAQLEALAHLGATYVALSSDLAILAQGLRNSASDFDSVI